MAKRAANAETMAAKQRDISVSEFFAKNRHLLGFDNPRKALLTTVKEAVDNALDACEEAGILPDITVEIVEIEPAPPASSKKTTSGARGGKYKVIITDNGPGIVRRQVENIFGKLLYGSKFHRLKMSRGQQGIGISAAGMYGLMTTGKPMVITTKPKKSRPAHHLELAMDTSKNQPEVTVDVETDRFPATSSGTGTRVEIVLEARYQRGKTSVEAYLEQTAIANPHAEITFIPPSTKGASDDEQQTLPDRSDAASSKPTQAGDARPSDTESANAEPAEQPTKRPIRQPAEQPAVVRTLQLDDRTVFPRAVAENPPETEEIKPHPYGVELGTFLSMLKKTGEKQLAPFFKNEFCRVTPMVIKDVTAAASAKGKSFSGQTWIKNVDHAAAEKLYKALQDAKLRSPPTDCLSPIGVRTLLAGMLKGVRAEFYAASTRSPAVYRGNPFQIEACIAFGGDLPGDQSARVIRFANRVPLLYQQSACCSFKAVTEASWKNYGLSQPRGALPVGPLVVMIHMASVWVPFTSESKEAIADYDEIRKEMKLALQECGRKLGTYIRKRQRMKREGQRRDVFERYIGEIARSCHALTGSNTDEVYDALMRQAKRRTEIADQVLDEDGKVVSKKSADGRDPFAADDGVIVLDSADSAPGTDDPASESNAAPLAEPKPTPSAARNGSGPTKRAVSKKKVKKKVVRKRGAEAGLFEG
ncbi:MAG: DNA topoisomerase VI subunit B [Planctomycetota bacterium]